MTKLQDLKALSLGEMEQFLDKLSTAGDSQMAAEGISFVNISELALGFKSKNDAARRLVILKRAIEFLKALTAQNPNIDSFEYSYMIARTKYVEKYNENVKEHLSCLEHWCFEVLESVPQNLLSDFNSEQIENLSVVDLKNLRTLKNRLKVLQIIGAERIRAISPKLRLLLNNLSNLP
jgi:hypothetical protein